MSDNNCCEEGAELKVKKFCEPNSQIDSRTRMSAVMEQLRVADLNCCKDAYATAKLPEKCISPPTCP